MKKVVIVLILFAVMLGFSAGELVFTNKFYKTQHELLAKVERRFDEDSENLSRAESKEAFLNAKKHWNKGKNLARIMVNHNTVKYIDEKYTALEKLIELNQKSDAYITLKTCMTYIDDIRDDNKPLITNIL